jgi:hypothetical protein
MQISEIKRLTSRDLKFIAFALQIPMNEVPNRTVQSIFDDMIGYHIAVDEYIDGKLERLLMIRSDRIIDRLEEHVEL